MVIRKFLLMIIIGFSFADILNRISPRKLDESYEIFGRRTAVNSDPKLMLVGLGNYKYSTTDKNLSFSVYLINSSKVDNLTNLNISIQLKNETKYIPIDIQCFFSSVKQNVKVTYECYKAIENVTNITDIKPNNFAFYDINNKAQNVSIEYSSYYKDSIKNLLSIGKQELTYSVFYLDIIEKNNNNYNLTGNFLDAETYNNTYMNLTLSNIILNCSIKDEKIGFDLKGKNINDKLHGKTLFGNNSKLVIYANDSVIDLIIYPNNNIDNNEFKTYMELLNFANYKSNGTNATVDAYFRGDLISLSNLPKYLRFPIKINNNNFKTATGIRNYTNLEKGYIIYAITIQGEENIKNITFNKTFSFSNDENFQTEIPIAINFYEEDLKIDNTDPFIYNVVNSTNKNATIDRNSFSLNFNYTNLEEVNLVNNSNVSLSFIPQENSTIRDKIYCTLFLNKTRNFTIVCRPKKDVYTFINTLIITPLNKIRRLRFLDDENYQPIYTLPNANGSINFDYSPPKSPTLRHTKNSLSAGAIVAIVLCTIAAILAVGVAFFFLSKPSVPPIKNQNQVIISNSTSSLNN